MHAVFKYELDDIEVEKINHFCNSVEYCSIEQRLGWTEIFFKSKTCYFYLLEEGIIKCYCKILENTGSAHIIFGPVCCDKNVMVYSIIEIIKYYKKRHFFYLGIQMYFKSGFDTEYIEYKLNRICKIHYTFNNGNTKSSIELNLEENIENILGGMRKGHKSDIRRASKMGITADLVSNTNELDSFSEIYTKMCHVRHLNDDELSKKNIHDIYNYLNDNKLGEVLIVKDDSREVIGGAILVYQGNTVRYLKGATDPDRRDLPILHLLMFEAIKKAHDEKYKYFDFWGYNHFANENDQVYNINHFKKGFGGYYTFFAKKMNIDLAPNGYTLYKSLLSLKNFLRKLSFK